MVMQNALSRLMGLVPKPIVRKVSRRYIAGEELEDALRTVRALNQQKICATLDVLGEFIHHKEQALAMCEHELKVLDAIRESGVDSNISIKLTSLGLKIDFEFCCEQVKALLQRAAATGNFVRIDMEDSSCTSPTLELYTRMRAQGFTNVGVVLQACLRRTAADIDALPAEGLNVRLCKGIYIEPEDIAFKDKEEVRENFKLLLRKLLDKGAYVGIATHDDLLIEDACALIQERRLPPSAYQFQMLLGVREERRTQLVQNGHPMRVYVPFGKDWYEYSLRRLKENPEMASHVMRAMFKRS
jgi:proline dehydrogenase